MTKRRREQHLGDLRPLPLNQSLWDVIAQQLGLPPQQKRIVELILRGQQDKQIASRLNISFPTVRTYLERIFDRLEVVDRMDLVLLIFSLSHEEGSTE